MRKNGFTLIELLAVIVILAIIALIATPIILGIINDAREESQERSVELYASAVRNGIAAYQLREMKEVQAGTYTSTDLPFDVEADGNVACDTIDIYEDGGVYVADCTVNGVAVEYTYGTKQEKVVKISDVCTLESGTALTQGAKYSCKVDPNKDAYTFYVLTTPASGATSVNLIMDSNIRTGGEAVKEANPTDKGLVAWTSLNYLEEHASQEDLETGENLNIYGPISAMEYLQEVTSSWTNVNAQTISTFTDDAGETQEMAETFTANARLPYLSEVLATGCDSTFESGACPLWMTNYLDGYASMYPSRTEVSEVYGYWTLSSVAYNSTYVWSVNCGGYANDFDGGVNNDGDFGVRPVITLSI